MTTEQCPCGSGNEYRACCEPFHKKELVAQTPEQLMRSRYSAFVKQLNTYLLNTWHPSTRPMSLDLADSPDWLKLQVLSSEESGNKGKVHFRAFYKEGSDVGFMEEHSDFIFEQGCWLYVNGEVK